MKAGDVVRNLYPRCRHEIGIIIETNTFSGTGWLAHTVLWAHGTVEYMNQEDVEVVSESR